MLEEFDQDQELAILEFDTVEEAVEFAKEINPKSTTCKIMLDENLYPANTSWMFVLGICDICGSKDCFFAPATNYDDGISGEECSNCSNMSLYPKEGSFEDE